MKTILCYGDSNTWGYIPASAEERYPRDIRWTGILQKMLGKDYYVIEEGLNGRTTCFDDPTWPNRNGYAQFYSALETHFPIDLVIFMLGSNDAKHIFPGKPYACGRALEQYYKQIHGGGYGPDKSDPQFLVISPPLIKSCVVSDSFDSITSVKFVKQLSSVYKRYTDMLGIHYMDAAPLVEADEADGLHLNPQGHSVLANAICKEVQRIL